MSKGAENILTSLVILVLFPRLPYNVAMKDKEIKIRADEDFVQKVDYIKKVNGYKTVSETIRRLVNREYMIYILEGIKEK